MNYCKVCRVCKSPLKQIPLRKMDSLIVLEEYCPKCNISEYIYENVM